MRSNFARKPFNTWAQIDRQIAADWPTSSEARLANYNLRQATHNNTWAYLIIKGFVAHIYAARDARIF